MTALLPGTTLQAQAVANLPDSTLASERAAIALAEFFRLLQTLPQTRNAYVGDGVGNVDVADRPMFKYVRVGSLDGDVAEARNMPLLAPASDDLVLIRRERPAGPGPWQIIEWFGAGTVPIVVCEPTGGIGRWWVNLGQGTIFEITAVSAGSGTGTIRKQLDAWNQLDWIAAPSASNLILVFDGAIANTFPPYWEIGLSTDEGDTYSSVYANNTENLEFFNAYWQMLFQDLSDGNINFGNSLAFAGGHDIWRFYATGNGGVSWSVVSYDAGSVIQFGGVSAPRHNGADSICIASWRTGTNVSHNYFQRINSAGSVLETYTMGLNAMQHTTVDGFTERGYAFRAACKYGDPDKMVILPFNSETDCFQFNWSTKTLSAPIRYFGTHPRGAPVHKQVLSTRAGTFLIVDSWGDAFSVTPVPWLIVWRSTDDGVTWTQIDLSAFWASNPAHFNDSWEYIAISSDDTLLIPLINSTCLFSTDDGVTWQQTDAFVPVDDWGLPFDVCGAGI